MEHRIGRQTAKGSPELALVAFAIMAVIVHLVASAA